MRDISVGAGARALLFLAAGACGGADAALIGSPDATATADGSDATSIPLTPDGGADASDGTPLPDGALLPDGSVPLDSASVDAPINPTCTIAWKASSTVGVVGTNTQVTVPAPASVSSGDVLLAFLNVGGSLQPGFPYMIQAPAGWVLVKRVDALGSANESFVVYQHVAAAAEPATYLWTVSVAVYAAAAILAYTGVDPATPIDVSAGSTFQDGGAAFPIPSVTTGVAAELLVTAVGGHAQSTSGTTWTPPQGATKRADVFNTLSAASHTRSTAVFDLMMSNAGASPPLTATPSQPQDLGASAAVALRPCH